MAHILVYLQRTPQGLHPGSAVALCLARDIASERGATISALCPGDAGPIDKSVVRAASRFGADSITFTGPGGLERHSELLRPVHVFGPWTPEGLGALQSVPGGPATPRWLDDPDRATGSADSVTGIIPGTLPWHEFQAELEADYEGDVEKVELPAWTKNGSEDTPTFLPTPDGPRHFVAPQDVGDDIRASLRGLGAVPASAEVAENLGPGTLIWLDAGPNGLPESLGKRDAGARVVLLPGPMANFHQSWALADWVLPGAWQDAVRELHGRMWATKLV